MKAVLSVAVLAGLLLWLAPPHAGRSQEATPPPPAESTPPGPQVHIVQEGENLTSIAALYEVSVADLLLVNGLEENAIIYPGDSLIIPGTGGDAIATSYRVQAGDTLHEVAARFGTTAGAVAAANNLVHPSHLYVGQPLAIVSESGDAEPAVITGTKHFVQAGETVLEIALRYGVEARELIATNDLTPPYYVSPGMNLRVPGDGAYRPLPGGWQAIELRPNPVYQGQTTAVYVEHTLPGEPTGSFAGQSLRFAPHEEGYVALVGVDAFTEPGRYELALASEGEAVWWPFTQEVAVLSSDYPTQTINVPAELAPLLAPEVRAEEDAFLSTYYSQFTPEPLWDGLFQAPVTNTVVTAGYGGARSYNGGPFEIFHTGVDYGGTVGTIIAAPAAGTVVYSGTVQLRGNTLIIDHGLGVLSGYYHLSEILVAPGQAVTAGQIVARGGSTGLSTGPHLHWELRVHDVPVDGTQWTQAPFP